VSERVNIEELRRLAGNVAEHMSDDRADMIDLAAAEIARLREERRWVPVGERLPEVGTDVLAMGGEGVFQARLRLWGESLRWEPLFLDFHGCGCCGEGRPNVTHWQPLPPGPEGNR
jgi:hypothetical protein